MRIYMNFKEAINEIKRDLKEMGIEVHPQTMQNKYVADNPDYNTLELQNYIYTVLEPKLGDLEVTKPWVDLEFEERINPTPNPGEAWKARAEVWQDLMNELGSFDYTYSERMWWQIENIINELKIHPDSRQLFLSIWNPTIDNKRMGIKRVPCSLGYLFQLRKGKLNVTYMMRSCDIVTHYQNDLYLCMKLTHYIAEKAGLEVGTFTHFVGSFHAYSKDLKGIF